MKNQQSVQENLISKIRSTLPVNVSLADELSDLFGISTDSAYRRIRGETSLTIEEITAVCQHFKISFDSLVSSHSGLVCFTYHEVNNEPDFIVYLSEIKKEMIRISKAPDKLIIYAAVDMPIFHYFVFPEYLYFKMFYWLRSVANDPAFQTKKFKVSDVSKEVIDICKDLSDLYSVIPSSEIWSDSILNSVLKQINYCWESGLFFNQDEALSLISAVRKTLEKVQRESEMNMKLLSSGHTDNFTKNYQLFRSEIEIGNNFILVRTGDVDQVYNSFHTFNKMVTSNPGFCKLTEKWMNNLMKQANLISGVAEKHRFQFFHKMYSQLDALVNLIEADTLS